MLDNFLNDDEDTASFLDQLEEESDLFDPSVESEYGFLGMTAGQRFILSLMVFILVLIASGFFLMITGSISLPIL